MRNMVRALLWPLLKVTPGSKQPHTRYNTLHPSIHFATQDAGVITSAWTLWLALFLFSILTLYQAVVLPLGEAADETDHYQYLRFVARAGHPPLTEAERDEAGFKGGLAPLYYWLTAWPVALVGEDSLPEVRRVDGRPERFIPTDGLGLNHVLHTLDEAWPWQGQVLAWHLARWLSLPLGWLTIVATYLLARRFSPEAPLVAAGAALITACLPRFVISSAAINDDNLVFALTAWLLLLQVRLWQAPPTGRLMALFGALFGLTLITKYFSLILIPEILLTLALVVWKRRQSSEISPARLLLPFFIALLLVAGPWFTFILLRFNRVEALGLIPGLVASLGEPQITGGLMGLLSGQPLRPPAATYPFLTWSGLLYRSFWFEYGWMQIFAPFWIYLLFTLFTLGALTGLLRTFYVSRFTFYAPRSTYYALPTNSPLSPPPPPTLLLLLHLTLFLLVVFTRYILSATLDTGQGRHLYPALPVIALALALGWHHLGQWGATFRLPPLALPALGYLLFFLLAAAACLLPAIEIAQGQLRFQANRFISPHYQTLPVTIHPLPLPVEQRLDLEFAPGLFLTGFQSESSATAGGALPMTLFWRAEQEARQDYLVSLCLETEARQPVGCWHDQFAGGLYPARAWEVGDTIIDTFLIPIPTCYRSIERLYGLHLTLWALDPTSPSPLPESPPIIDRLLSPPAILLRPTVSLLARPQQAELWTATGQLVRPAHLELRQFLAHLSYRASSPEPQPLFQAASDPAQTWSPHPFLETVSALPCADGPEPLATFSFFSVDPTLASGVYQTGSTEGLPEVTLTLRDRVFAPLTSSLTFSQTLAPLTLGLPEQSQIDLSSVELAASPAPYPLTPGDSLPLTLRWQARRWMAEPLVIALKLLDKDFVVAGERLATLGDRYPNVLWAPGELVEETYLVPVSPGATPGLYRLEISLIRQDRSLPEGYEALPLLRDGSPEGTAFYPLTVRLLDPAQETSPPSPFQAQLGPAIHLFGYELKPNFSKAPPSFDLALYWRSTSRPAADYTVFTQLVGPDGQVWAQWDNPPQAGRYPTSAWTEADTVIDRYTLSLREGAPPGLYRLLVGMYDPLTKKRLPATVAGAPQPDNALLLTTMKIN